MQCWKCDKPAHGICKFCGRAICKEHASEMPSIVTVYPGEKQTPKAIVVSNALFCGVCRPQPEPIDVPEIF
ncbi:hypothetical protein [Candidatus Formimonas warabiya]|uniref:hypothetical protein n=1 Tax=Formimonas warabiya TaxID=1761012 RepID=UPI0011D03C98|nr:hypothetical protein [Candidatus Formimonas warabiya]